MQGNVQTALIGTSELCRKVEHTATYCESVARNAHAIAQFMPASWSERDGLSRRISLFRETESRRADWR